LTCPTSRSPEKNPSVKGTYERFARLGAVAAILRDAERRERYDFFYINGVPRWPGIGYYYERFRSDVDVRPFPAIAREPLLTLVP
jgi:curved DNA-binding protein CbpA